LKRRFRQRNTSSIDALFVDPNLTNPYKTQITLKIQATGLDLGFSSASRIKVALEQSKLNGEEHLGHAPLLKSFMV
jgi:hypothetical protein